MKSEKSSSSSRPIIQNNHDYIEISLPKLNLSNWKRVTESKLAPLIVVLLFIAAYLLGCVTANIQPFIK